MRQCRRSGERIAGYKPAKGMIIRRTMAGQARGKRGTRVVKAGQTHYITMRLLQRNGVVGAEH